MYNDGSEIPCSSGSEEIVECGGEAERSTLLAQISFRCAVDKTCFSHQRNSADTYKSSLHHINPLKTKLN
jgi:hypothetical protein